MRIVYDLEAFGYGVCGGVARVFREVIERLAKQPDFAADLYVIWRATAKLPEGHNIRRHFWKGLPNICYGINSIEATYHFVERLYWNRPNRIFHPTGYPTEKCALYRLPTVITIHDLVHEHIPAADNIPSREILLARKKFAIEHANRIICVSNATRDALNDFYGLESDDARVSVIHNGVNDCFKPYSEDEMKNALGNLIPDNVEDFILYIGSRQRYKNYHRLLKAYRTWSNNDKLSLVVVGAPPSPGDYQIDELLPPNGNVVYLNNISDAALCSLYQKAAFFVYPSLEEGFGIPLLEALASGGKVCASDIPAFHEVGKDAIHYFDPLSIDSMHAAFDITLTGAPLPRKTIEDLIAPYSWDRCARKYLKVYREVSAEA